MYYPNGTRAWYGVGWNSRSKLEWAIHRWQDPQGNYVAYNYQSDNGLLSIKTIKFGGRIGGSSPTNQINFTYVSRNRPENVYIGGYNFRRTNLLRNIQVTANGSPYRKYELTYNTTSLGYQRLTSVKEYNAQNKALRPIIFDYENTSSWMEDRQETRIYNNFDYKTNKLVVGDYNGDGRTDVIFYDKNSRNQLFMHTRLHKEYSAAYQINTEKFSDIFSSTILSWNNKILSQQAVTTVRETSSYNSSTSSIRFRTFAQAAYGPVHQYDKVWNTPKYKTDKGCRASNYSNIPKKYVSGDFNGDGLTDVLAIEKQYSYTICQPRECDGDDAIRKVDNKSKNDGNNTERGPILLEGNCCKCTSYSRNKYYTKVHFINLNRTLTSNFANVAGSFRKGVDSKDRIEVADHNGDGKQDIYHFKEGKLYIYTLNTSNKLVLLYEETDSGIQLEYPILLGDFNGDGKTDLVIATANKSKNWRFYISKNKEFYKQTKELPFAYYKDEGVEDFYNWRLNIYEYKYIVRDINGDGKSDFLMHNVNSYKKCNHRVINNGHRYCKRYSDVITTKEEFISIYKNEQRSFSTIPYFSYDSGYSKEINPGDAYYGIPFFTDLVFSNSIYEYGYISHNKIYFYEFKKDHKKDVTLKSVTNNGVKTTIDYAFLGDTESHIYISDYSQNYPYVNVNRANSFQLVKKLTEEGDRVKRYQDFLYHGAVSNIHMGFQGFLKTRRSNWYGDGVGKLWTISKHDVTKKGVVTEQWVSTSFYEGSNYMSKTTNTFNSSLAGNKVFTNIPIKIVQHDALTGVTTTKTITYDSYKNPLTENTVYNGGNENITYTYSNNLTANSQYYHVGRLTKKIETNTIGGNAFTTEEQYSYSNNLLTQQKVKGNRTPWNTESFTYDAFGNVTKKTLTPAGLSARTENFKYDSSGRFLIESIDIEGLKTKFTYDVFGNPLTTTNPYNQVTRFSYDGWNRLVSEKNYLGKTTTFTYSHISGGGMSKRTSYPDGKNELIGYNAFGWVTATLSPSIDNKWVAKEFKYDVAGRKIKESEPFLFPSSSATQWNTIAFDRYGREATRTSYNRLVANISYNGLVATVDDGTKTVTTTKDGAGNIIKMQDPGGTITYTYYGNGVMKSANYGSHTVRTEIDGWGRKIKLIDPTAGTYTYKYNNIGELLEETTPKGKTTYAYDNYGKIITKKVDGDQTDLNLNYTYNAATKLLTSIQGNNGRTNENYRYTYSYDTYKRLYLTKEFNSKADFEHRVERDNLGRVYAETYTSKDVTTNVSSTVKVRNIYDTNSGILTEIKDFNANTSLWKLRDINQRGQSKEILLGNGMVKKRTYDQFGFLTKILDQTSGNTPKTALNLEYSFNTQRGNLNSRKNNNLGWNESFAYDNLDRLTNISGSVSRSQQYDGRGRITSNSEIGTYNYGSTSSYRLQEVNLNTQGDLYYQNQPIQKITYNAYKKPISIRVKDKASVYFEYGILQNRSHAYYGGNEDNTLNQRYHKHYSAITPVEIEVDKQGNTKIITYIGGDAYSAPIAHIKQTASNSANGYHYLHRDYLGSILAISDGTGTVQEQRQFGAWGEVDKFKSLHSEIDFEHNTTLLNRGYTGHEHFMGVALLHMNGRMYDAKLGRFLSPDNYIQEPFSTQSFNRFGYVWNNPLKYTDPSGELGFLATILIGALISVTTNGIINSIEGRPFFQGAELAALTGAIGGAFAFGIGEAVSGLQGFLKVAVQTVAHGHLGGMMSATMGGDYFSGFAAGAIGSTIGHYSRLGLQSVGASNFWKAAGTITAGSLSGGVGSVIAGGKFWDGFRNGAISSALNHALHSIIKKIKIPSPKKIKEAYPKNPYDQEFCSSSPNECAIRMSETFDDLGIDISSSDRFRKVHTEGGVVHQPSAKAFADWLWGDTELGRPEIMNSNGVAFELSDFKGKNGLIYFVHPEYGGTNYGHIDVIHNGAIGSGFYKNHKIWFWEFKNDSYVKN